MIGVACRRRDVRAVCRDEVLEADLIGDEEECLLRDHELSGSALARPPHPSSSPSRTTTSTPFPRSHPNRLSTAARPSALVLWGTVTSRRAPGPARCASRAISSAVYAVSQVTRSTVHLCPPGARGDAGADERREAIDQLGHRPVLRPSLVVVQRDVEALDLTQEFGDAVQLGVGGGVAVGTLVVPVGFVRPD